MKKVFGFYTDSPLILRIAIGLVIGIVLGIWVPQAQFVSIFGTIFVGALKAIAPILVFVLVVASLSSAGKGLGSRFTTVIFLYMLSTFLAAVVAVVASYLFPVTIPLAGAEVIEQTAPQGLGEVFETLLSNMVSNPITAIIQNNYVGILTWAVFLGLALRLCASDKTKDVLNDISTGVSKVVGWVIQIAPFGIMGLVYVSINENGLEIFTSYGMLLLVLVGCMLAVALVVDPIVVAITLKKNPYPLVFKCFKESGVTAFFTRSSAANIPVNMKLCDKLGLDKE